MFSKLRLSQKLFLVTALLAVPLLFITGTFVQQTRRLTLRNLQQQLDALPVLMDLSHLGKLIQDRGAKLPLWIIGSDISPLREEESESAIREVTDRVGRDFEKLENFDRGYWKKLEKQIAPITENPEGKAASFSNFAEASESLASSINTLSYQFRFYSTSTRFISVSRLAFDLCPAMAVSVNRLRGLITYKAFIKEKSLDDIRNISRDLTLANFRMHEIELAGRDIKDQNALFAEEIDPEIKELSGQMRDLAKLVEIYSDLEGPDLDAENFFQSSSRVLESVENLKNASINAISLNLRASIEQNYGEIRFLVGLVTISSILVTCLVFFMARSLVRGVRKVENLTERIARGQRDIVFQLNESGDEIESIVHEIYKIYLAICNSESRSRLDNWLLKSQKSINDRIRAEKTLEGFAEGSIRAIAETVGADAASFYIVEEQNAFLLCSYGANASPQIRSGDGLIGAAIVDGRMRLYRSVDIPGYKPRVESALGSAIPCELIIFPIKFEDEIIAVMEFLSFRRFADNAQPLLEAIEENTAILMRNVQGKLLVENLLRKTQLQSEELRSSNIELEEKSDLLSNQQKMLREANEELEEQRAELEAQNEKLEKVVDNLAVAKKDAEEATRDAEQANRFKTIFLANISHELRTPLNSIMILSQILAENREGNLSSVQTKNASTIHSSGRDLLNLINEILDLSKIEAGKLDIHSSPFSIADVAGEIRSMHEPLAQKKDLAFEVLVDADCPQSIDSDMTRVTQIIRNFVANAIKFTEEGSVRLRFSSSQDKDFFVQVAVEDTGTGIPREKQELIFEPFKQLNNSLSRKHEGTGLGLSISLNLAKKLGGRIDLRSEPGKGSTFTLFLPEHAPGSENSNMDSAVAQQAEILALQARDYLILALGVDDELADSLKAKCLAEDFRCISVERPEQLNALASKISPRGIVLNLDREDPKSRDLLDDLKANPRTRSIPLHLLRPREKSTIEQNIDDVGLFLHSIDNREKTPSEDVVLKEDVFNHKKILLVDDDIRNVYSLRQVLQSHGCETTVAVNGREALESLEKNSDVNLVLMDIMMPEMDGFEAMRRIRQNPRHKDLPIIALTAKAMKSDREHCLEAGANDYLMKPIDSERLISLMRVWLSK